MKKIFPLITFILFIALINGNAQSFDGEKTAMVNFVKRMYNASPFEGAKELEGENKRYFIVAISIKKLTTDSSQSYSSTVMVKAQDAAEKGFAQPCVKFEMLGTMDGVDNKRTYLFACETLSEFVVETIKKKVFDGARIIATPRNKYLIAVVTLEDAKYSSITMRDKAAQMKAKQMTNALLNGSVITSDAIIKTDENDKSINISSTEIVKEYSMGFINGIELLSSQEIIPSRTTYIYYTKNFN